MEHRRPSAGDAPHEGPLKRADVSRVCVKASPAFGRRRLHRNTDYIDCPALGLAKLGLGQTWSGQTWSWPNLVWPNLVLAKLGLAKLGNHSWPNLDLAKLGLAQTNRPKSGIAHFTKFRGCAPSHLPHGTHAGKVLAGCHLGSRLKPFLIKRRVAHAHDEVPVLLPFVFSCSSESVHENGALGGSCSHGSPGMDQSGSPRRLVASYPWPETIREMAHAVTASCIGGSTTEWCSEGAVPHQSPPAATASVWVEDVRVASFHRSSCAGLIGAGASQQVGESTCSNGGNRRYQNRHHPQCSRACQEGIASTSSRVADQGLRGVLGQGQSPSGGIGLRGRSVWNH